MFGPSRRPPLYLVKIMDAFARDYLWRCGHCWEEFLSRGVDTVICSGCGGVGGSPFRRTPEQRLAVLSHNFSGYCASRGYLQTQDLTRVWATLAVEPADALLPPGLMAEIDREEYLGEQPGVLFFSSIDDDNRLLLKVLGVEQFDASDLVWVTEGEAVVYKNFEATMNVRLERVVAQWRNGEITDAERNLRLMDRVDAFSLDELRALLPPDQVDHFCDSLRNFLETAPQDVRITEGTAVVDLEAYLRSLNERITQLNALRPVMQRFLQG